MNTIMAALRDVTAFVHQHHEALLIGGLGLTALLLLAVIRKAATSERPDKWLATVSLLVGFAWSAEAMWEVATQKLDLAPSFAVFAFFVFESQLAVSMMRAERHYRLHKHPGKHGRTAWLVAVVMGVVAALAGDSPVEVVLRLVVPLLVTQQWWVGMTGDGVTKPADAITWNWPLRRILVTIGLARPGEHNLVTVDRERQIFAIAKVSHRLHSTAWRWRKAWCEMRLRRLAMSADDDMLDAARIHVERVWRSADRTRPVGIADLAVVEAAFAEAERARTQAELARTAQQAAVLSAQAAHDFAEAQAARILQILAQVQEIDRRAEAEATRAHKAEVDAAAATARAAAEAALRAEAQAKTEAARQEARAADMRASKAEGKSTEAAAAWKRELDAAQEAAAQARRNVTAEQQKVQQALNRAVLAEDHARDSGKAYEAAARKVEELTRRLAEPARIQGQNPLSGRPGAEAASNALAPRSSSTQRSTAATGESQADRAAWIAKRIEEGGRPHDEEGWAALTKAVQAKFSAVSVRTARRDVQPFKDRDLVMATQ